MAKKTTDHRHLGQNKSCIYYFFIASNHNYNQHGSLRQTSDWPNLFYKAYSLKYEHNLK